MKKENNGFADVGVGLLVYNNTAKIPAVNLPTSGHGTLRMNGGAVARGIVSAGAHAANELDHHMVSLVMKESFLGGCELEVKLSAEDAASLASTIYHLAKQAMIKNESEMPAENTAAA